MSPPPSAGPLQRSPVPSLPRPYPDPPAAGGGSGVRLRVAASPGAARPRPPRPRPDHAPPGPAPSPTPPPFTPGCLRRPSGPGLARPSPARATTDHLGKVSCVHIIRLQSERPVVTDGWWQLLTEPLSLGAGRCLLIPVRPFCAPQNSAFQAPPPKPPAGTSTPSASFVGP